MTIFRRKGGGVWAESKKSLSEKTEVVKKGGGGGLIFLTGSKKKQFFYIHRNMPHIKERINISFAPTESHFQCSFDAISG